MSLLAIAPLLTARSADSQRRPFVLAARAAARRRSKARVVLPAACLIAAVAFAADLGADATAPALVSRTVRAAARAEASPRAIAATELVRSWKAAGDEATVLERLGGADEHAGGTPAWSAQFARGETYLVVYREPAGWPAYAFEADLASGAVTPTPETLEALALMKVRDEAQARLDALARR